MTVHTRIVASPTGPLRITAEGNAIARIDWFDIDPDPEGDGEDPLLDQAAHQLAEYFAGTRRAFELPLAPAGSAHDRQVWQQMMEIPYGATKSYGELARAIASSPRAVGTACGRNPIPIIVPCHRVLAANGGIGGYSGQGGTATKRRLLALEGAMLDV